MKSMPSENYQGALGYMDVEWRALLGAQLFWEMPSGIVRWRMQEW
jgi:hypothetical protein